MNYSDLSTEQQMIAETKKYVNNKALDVQSDWNESDSSAGDYIKNKPTLGTAAVLDVASSGDASSSQIVKGDDSRLTNSRNAADVYSWAKEPNKPTYTASEVDAYTKTESDNKYVTKETGKGLSTNDFTAEYINAINDNTDNISDNTIAIQTNATNITALQNNKVDKVVGKGLSTNDFTNNFKKGIAISQELAYDRATIPQPNLDADFHTVNGERTVIYQGNAYSFNTMTYNPITKKYVYGIRCTPVYQGGLFFCEVDNPASDRHNWLDQTTFPTDILINGDIYTAVMPTGEAYYVAYSYNNNDEKELVYSDALDSSRFDYWVKTEIIIDSIFNIGNYVFYVADNKVYKYEFAHGSVELDFDTVPFAYTYGGGRCIALTKNQYNVISAFMSYDGIEWTKVNFPSINKTNKPSGLIYDHGIFLFYQEDDEYVITSKDGFSWEKHKLSIDMTEFRENFMIFDEIGWGGGIFYACVNSVDEGHYDDYTIWTSQDGYTWEQTVKYLEDEIDNKTDYYNGTYLISVAQNLYYPTYRLDGVYGKGDVYTKSESDNKYVAKETGKGLSTNDYTIADKNKLAGIEAEANKTVVDSAMSDSSTNPLQNKVITKELEGAKTATGNPLTIEDAAPVNAVNLSMDLEPIQAGSGTPSPDNIRPISGRSQVIVTIKDNPSEPTVTKNYTIQLGQTVYGGQLDVTKGKMVVDRGYITLSSPISKSGVKYLFNYGSNTLIENSDTQQPSPKFKCDSFAFYSIQQVVANNYVGISISKTSGGYYLYDLNTIDMTLSDAQTYYENNPLHVVYPLAEPYTIQLTPQQIKLLENTNTLSSDDTITLEYQPNNAIGEAVRVVEENYETRVSLLENRNTAKVYGFHISSTESDPAAKVTYLADAVGMTPAHMNFSTGKFDYGSWEDIWFIKECKPCIFAQAGYVMKYLDPDDYTKDIDGNTVAIDGGLTGANVMIEFPKIWYKVTPDGNDENSGTVSISSVKIDEGYKDYAYIDYQGNHKEHFYMPVYNGSLINNVMRSVSGVTISKTLDAQTEINYCKANGNGWNTEDAGEIMLINFLLILMGKSTDTQTVYGQGLHTGGTEAINDGFRTGVHNDKGMFYGTNSGTIASGSYGNAVKVFGIENYWGFQWRRYVGDMLVNGVRKIKLCYGTEDGSTVSSFNSTGSGYVDVGATPSGTSGGYISQIKFTTNGMFSKVSSGSSATYFCDGQWFNNSATFYALRGGDSGNGAPVGAFCVTLNNDFSHAGWTFGAAPSYK